MIRVGAVSGTFERQVTGYPVGMLAGLARALPPDRYSVEQIPYDADYGRRVDFAQSMAEGRAAVRRWVGLQASRSRDPIWLIGYSQGAIIVGDVIAFDGLPVAGAVLVGDGMRAAGECHTGRSVGYGLAGMRPLVHASPRVFQVAIPDDPICSAPRESLLRNVADLTTIMSMNDPLAWAEDVAGKLRDRRLQNLPLWTNALWALGRTPVRVIAGLGEVQGYLHSHVAYGTRRIPGTSVTYLERGAALLRGAAGA